MCGIIGILKAAEDEALLSTAISKLKLLEYRGYDSWGCAFLENNAISCVKKAGRVTSIDSKPKTHSIICHTRWATHGGVTDENAHPHYDCKKRFSIIHNGIIENYLELKEELGASHAYLSQTDSEVIAHLLENNSSTFLENVLSTVRKLKGSFGLVVLDSQNPHEMIAAKNESPLVVGVTSDSIVFSSDPLGLPNGCNVYYLLEGELAHARISDGKPIVEFYSYSSGVLVKKTPTPLEIDAAMAERGSYAHYMQKEIMEQPLTLRHGMDRAAAIRIAKRIKGKKVVAVACGTARHAAVIGKHLLHRIAHFPIEVMMAHEFSYFVEDCDQDTVILAVSQSGETADVLEVMRKAHAKGLEIVSIVNVPTSTLARASNDVFPLNCGPEISVASTKAFSNMVLAFYLIAYALDGSIDKNISAISRLIFQIEKRLPYFDLRAYEIAQKIHSQPHAYVLGKGVNFAIALEGALKIKEITYIHAEGMPSGELKHGTLALIEENTPVILLAPTDYTYNDSISNGMETKARGAFLIGISNKNHPSFNEWIELDELEDALFYPLVATIPLQLIAYHCAVLLKRDVDKPRNLAKSVTVK